MQDLVHWFVVLAEEENVTAAAARLQMPQPTLSRRLASLEHRLGTTLFDRVGRRLQLNEAGRVYAEHVRRADDQLAAGELAIQDLRGGESLMIRLGFLHSFGSWLVPEVILRSRKTLAGIRFELTQGAADVITAAVADGDIDLGIVSPRPTDSRVQWRRLITQGVLLALPSAHRLAGQSSVDFAELADDEFIAMETGFGMRQILDEMCEQAGFSPRISVECQELDTVSGLVSAGIGVALLPSERVRRVPPGVVLLEVTGADAAREIGLIWSRGSTLSKQSRAVRAAAVEAVRANPT